ncbi:MAG: SanA/YdcF family protein [Candidatus Dojkabacteria bacterium]
MRKKIVLATIFLLVSIFMFLFFAFPYLYVQLSVDRYVSEDNQFDKEYDAVIVLGASVFQDKPSSVLANRIEAGLMAAKTSGTNKVLLSGATDGGAYNEPQVMLEYALEQNDEVQYVLDEKGERTYQSCKRAKEEFGYEDVLVVSQDFHIERAVFLCHGVGLNAIGVVAENTQTTPGITNYIREYFAYWVALFDVLK